MTDSVRVTLAGAGLTLPLALYLGAWVVGGLAAAWATWRLFRAREPDGTPTLFHYLRLMPKQEALMAVGIALVFGTAVPTLWRLAFGQGMGPAFGEWLLFLAGLLAINGATYVGKRATHKPGAEPEDA